MKHYKLIAGILFVLLLTGILTMPITSPGDGVIFVFYLVGIIIASLLGAAGIGAVLDKRGTRKWKRRR